VFRSEFRLLALVSVCALLGGACSSAKGEHGVAVRSLNTNIGLGIDVGANAAPANSVVAPRQQQIPDQAPPTFTIPPFDFGQAPQPHVKCPAAGPFDFPSEEAGVVPKGRPAAASYVWKLDGNADNGAGPQKIDNSETRTIKNISDVSGIPNAFRYSQTQTFLVDQRQSGVLTTTFRVVPDSPAQTRQTNSDTGRGVFIESIAFEGRDASRNQTHTTFNPQPPVQMMAFPVVQGAGVAGSTPQTGTPITTSSGTDPNTGNQLTLTGKVFGKKQVDACGKKIDSWLVKATESYRYTNTKNQQTTTLQSTYDYAIALQYGSLLVYEHTEAPSDTPVVVLDARVGRIPKATGT
jgi:hypothetical protein